MTGLSVASEILGAKNMIINILGSLVYAGWAFFLPIDGNYKVFKDDIETAQSSDGSPSSEELTQVGENR